MTVFTGGLGRTVVVRLMVCTFALAAALVLWPVSSSAQAVSYSSQEIQLAQMINDHRESLGLNRLMVSDLASVAAERHSSDMATYEFFSHTTRASDFFPVGSDAGDRLLICGYPSYAGWGENIAAGFSTASGVFQAWLGSSDHCRMMTYSGFKVMGVGLVYAADSPYGCYWTVDFGAVVDSTARWLDGSSPTTSTTTTPTTTISPTTSISTTTTTTAAPPTATTTTTAPPTTITTTTTTTAPPSTTTTTTATTSTTGPSTTTTTAVSPPPFPDVPTTHRFYEPIVQLAAAGVVNGYEGGLFRPEDFVTRAQFAKILVLALGAHTSDIDNADSPTFIDVLYTGNAYPFDFVEEAAGLGIIQGRDDGTFAPQADVTRVQLALMLVRAGQGWLAAPPVGYQCSFEDVPAYGRDAVDTAFYNGLLVGKTATRFDPYSPATRGHVAKMVHGLMQVLNQ